jgi:hypothetical protein
MSSRFPVKEVASSTPYDGDVTGYGDNVQDAIDNLGGNVTGKPRAFLIAGYNGTAGLNKYLEYFASVSSDSSPWVAAEPGSIKALSLSARLNTTCTITLFINGVSEATISLSSSRTAAVGSLNIAYDTLDEFSCQVTSGSVRDPIFSTKVETDL